MLNIGTTELIIILVLALLILGPTKLPQVARTIGKGLASLRKSAEEVKREIDIEGIRHDIEQDSGVDELKQMVDVRGEIRRALNELEDPDPPQDEKVSGEADGSDGDQTA
jgi:sec-independent protein translocase protein TatB